MVLQKSASVATSWDVIIKVERKGERLVLYLSGVVWVLIVSFTCDSVSKTWLTLPANALFSLTFVIIVYCRYIVFLRSDGDQFGSYSPPVGAVCQRLHLRAVTVFPWDFPCKWAKAWSVSGDGGVLGGGSSSVPSVPRRCFSYKQWSHTSRGAGIHAISDDVIGSQSTCWWWWCWWGGSSWENHTCSVLSQLLLVMWRFCTCSVSCLLAGTEDSSDADVAGTRLMLDSRKRLTRCCWFCIFMTKITTNCTFEAHFSWRWLWRLLPITAL